MKLSLMGLLLLLSATLAASPLQVVVSIPPQRYLVERIGGEQVEVTLLLRPGDSPATFEPSARQMAQISEAALYYRIGVPFEQVWMARVLSINPHLSLLDARDGIELRRMMGAAAAGDERQPQAVEADPHIWLDPQRMQQMAAHLRDRLIELVPNEAAYFRANYQRLEADLLQLDRQIRKRLAPYNGAIFMVFHPSWGYFAERYGLQQLPIEREGKAPGGRALVDLVGQARQQGIRAIFVQQQISRRQAEALAGEMGLRVIVIDPLAERYLDNMRSIADAIAGGIGGA